MTRRIGLGIGGWLGLGSGVAVATLLVLGAVGWAALQRVSLEAQRSSERVLPRVVATQRLQAAVLGVGINARAYALLREDANLREYIVADAALGLALDAATATSRSADDEAIFTVIPPRVRAFQRSGSVLVELARRRAPQAELRRANAEMAQTRDAVTTQLDAYFSLQRRKLEDASASIVARRGRIQRGFLWASGASLLLLAASALLTVRAVRRPAARMVAAARDLARGDWGPALALREERPPPTYRNELRELSASFGQMAAELQSRDAELRAHRERLLSQNEALQAQQEELQLQQEELQSQHEELQAQNEQLTVQDEALRAQAQALQRSAAALQETDRRRSEFLAMLSHELRNPLAAILSGVDILERAEPGSEPSRRARVVIARQLQQLGRLVDDLLDITRITRHKVQLQRAPVDLVQLLHDAADDHGPMMESRGIRLELELPGTAIWLDADPARLAQVIGNLLQNAAKFTDRGGRVRISLAVDGGERAVIRVADTGIGIDPATLERLFEPFTQAERSLARTRGGLGLGLSLVKGLVELHGGTVQATSAGAGCGTEVVVELPIVEARRTLPSPPAPPVVRGRRVLVVDDNADAAESLGALLELAGHHVALAHRGQDGLRHAQREPPDAVLCDIGLPDIDGYEVARRFRADPALRNVILVALSGYALDEDLRRAEEAGFDAHVAKPATLDKLLELIGRAPIPAREQA